MVGNRQFGLTKGKRKGLFLFMPFSKLPLHWILFAIFVGAANLRAYPEGGGEVGTSAAITRLHHQADSLIALGDSSGVAVAEKALGLAKLDGKAPLVVEGMQKLAEAYTAAHQYPKSLQILREALEKGKAASLDKAETRTLSLMGEAYLLSAVYDSAELYLGQSLERMEGEGGQQTAEYNKTRSLLGQAYRYLGDFVQALDAQYASLAFFEEAADSESIATTKERIAVVKFLQGELDPALEIFGEVLSYRESKADSQHLGFIYTAMGLVNFRRKDFDQSIEFAWKSVEIRQRLEDVRGLGESYNNLALAYMGKEDWKMALEYLQLSKTALIKGHDLREIPVILGNMGDCYRYLGKSQQALRYYKEALERAKESGGKHNIFNIYRKITTVYAESGDLAKAYEYSVEFGHVKDSIYNLEKEKAISELELKYEKEKDQQKIALLERDKKLDENRKWFLRMWLVLLAAISILGIALLWTRIRKNRQIYAREKEIHAAREALTEAELRNTRNELSYNKNRLSVYMDNLLNKNSLIEDLEARLNALTLDDEASQAERAQRLNELLELKILTDDDWLAFKQHFEQAFPGFLERLRNAFSNLTTAEVRLFLLIRLGLGSREISNMLGVSPDSVKKGRHRLRKKLDLAEEDSLEDFVAGFN